jgi:cell wall-associated NlpC family hydrolase
MSNVIDYADKFIGVPYKWGGDNPIDGFDCSGYVQWVLQGVGIDPKGDQTAQDLFNYFLSNGDAADVVKAGTLVFYGKSPNHITHVAIANGPYTILEAGGGDSRTKTLAEAKKRGACVRQRPYNYRKDLVAMITPRYNL